MWSRVHKRVLVAARPVDLQTHSGGFSVMRWGCFSFQGLGPLVALDGSMNAQTYHEQFRDALLPELTGAGVPMGYMQHNAPCHKAKLIMDFLSQNEIHVLDWPAHVVCIPYQLGSGLNMKMKKIKLPLFFTTQEIKSHVHSRTTTKASLLLHWVLSHWPKRLGWLSGKHLLWLT
jgi:hypothetical protein